MIKELHLISFVLILLLCNSCNILKEKRVNRKLHIFTNQDQEKFTVIDAIWIPDGEVSNVIEFKLRDKDKGVFSIYRYSYCHPEPKYRECLAYVSEFKGDTIILYNVDKLRSKKHENSFSPIYAILTDQKSLRIGLNANNIKKAFKVDSIMSLQIKNKCQ